VFNAEDLLNSAYILVYGHPALMGGHVACFDHSYCLLCNASVNDGMIEVVEIHLGLARFNAILL